MSAPRLLALTATVVALSPPRPADDRGAAPFPSDAGRAGDRAEVLTLREEGSRMILVPGGSFVMGSTGDEIIAALLECHREPGGHRCEQNLFANEGGPHRVTLSPYWLDRTEVTVGDYARCVAVGRCRALPYGEGGVRFERDRYPASLVTWEEAKTYCEYRGARLPTEAEFERAARGLGGRRYPWGDLYNGHVANHGRLAWQSTDASDGYPELAPVGSFPAGRTPEGFLDLAGNVSEWVSDRYAPEYDDGAVEDPEGPALASSTPARVVRGGDYQSAGPWLRGAARAAEEPGTRRPWIGFRCAKSAKRR